METKEKNFSGVKINGFLMLLVHLVVIPAFIVWMAITETVLSFIGLGIAVIVWFVLLAGYIKLEPNEGRVMVFFGDYKGTFKNTGFYWVNPFMDKKKISLRARNLDIEPIKVNDKIGNPVLIGMVLVWKLSDTYKAMFEIDSQTMAGNSTGINPVNNRMLAFQNFVKIQSDAALRQVAGQYAYDENETEGEELTLRSDGDEINEQLVQKLNERLAMAGLEVLEARINYLAYAPEIAAVMLRRQQASAIIGARGKIVEGAVSMVHMALDKLKADDVVELDEEKKAAMVSNLLVVLCADESAQPVVNTGTLNH